MGCREKEVFTFTRGDPRSVPYFGTKYTIYLISFSLVIQVIGRNYFHCAFGHIARLSVHVLDEAVSLSFYRSEIRRKT